MLFIPIWCLLDSLAQSTSSSPKYTPGVRVKAVSVPHGGSVSRVRVAALKDWIVYSVHKKSVRTPRVAFPTWRRGVYV